MLARREHSRREIQAKLIEKGFAPALAAQAAAALEADGLLSDRRFAEALLSARRRRGYGPVRIRQELKEKGVDADVIEAVLDAGDSGWLDELVSVKTKKFGARPPAGAAERAKQIRFLQYRGFTLEQIQQVLNSRHFD